MGGDGDGRDGRDGGSAADRLLTVLAALAAAEGEPSLADLARDTALPKPTLHRLLRLLEERGFAARGLDGRGFTAGAALVGLAERVLHGRLARAPCHAVLERLSRAVGETCNLVVLHGHVLRYADRVETDWPLRLSFRVGQEVPVHCTATGKLLLALQPARLRRRLLDALDRPALTPRTLTDRTALEAALERIRQQGYGTDDQEFVPGMVAVAVPVDGGHGPPLAALSIHAPAARCGLEDLIGVLPLLREAAAALSALAREGAADREAA